MFNNNILCISKCSRRTSKHLKISTSSFASQLVPFSQNGGYRHLKLKHNINPKVIRLHLVYSSSSSNSSIISTTSDTGLKISKASAYQPSPISPTAVSFFKGTDVPLVATGRKFRDPKASVRSRDIGLGAGPAEGGPWTQQVADLSFFVPVMVIGVQMKS